MLVNSTIIDNEFIGSSAPRLSLLSMKPYKKYETFVRWAICYLSQFGKHWLIDSRTQSFDNASWEGRRYNFAAEVWATASLRMETDCDLKGINPKVTVLPGNKDETSFLAPNLWSEFSTSPNDQLFAKKVLLDFCYRTKKGFPYNTPILLPEEGNLSSGVHKALINDALSELPSHLFDIVDGLKPEQLEWFAIFICIGEWNGCAINDGSFFPSDHSPGSITRTTPAVNKSALKSSHAPVRLLQDQLGMDDDLTLNKCTFPFVRQGYGRFLWRNRSVLQVSARIDNWLALSIGHQFSKLFRRNAAFGPDSDSFIAAHMLEANVLPTPPASSVAASESQPNVRVNEHERSDRIFKYHRHLEMARLRYQLARVDAPFRHLDQGITFMGCAMESLRSFLAEHLGHDRHQLSDDEDSNENIESWTPPLPVDTTVSFPISSQLVACFKALVEEDPKGQDRFDSTMQERLLWECQNGVVKILEEKLDIQHVDWENDKRPQEFAQTMMLVIFAFPALHVQHMHPNVKKDASETLTFSVSALASPQRYAVIVEGSATNTRIIMRLIDESGEQPQFRWQDWRDAFLGRLFGKAEWQRSHYMRDLQVNRTRERMEKRWKEVPIGENRAIPLWEGWQPFRARIRKYELEHSSLIIVGDEMPLDASTSQMSSGSFALDVFPAPSVAQMGTRDAMTGPKAYTEASSAALSDASAHVDSVLRLNSSLFDKHERKKHQEPSSEDEFFSGPILMSSPRLSPDSSSDQPSSVRMLFNKTLEEDLIERVNEQDVEAMHTLAKHLLDGIRPFRKDKARALLLLERAIAIGRKMKTVRRFVKALLDSDKVSDEAVERALAAVERLWRDMPTRHSTVRVGGHRRREWRDNADGEEERRMQKLVALHLKVVNMRRRAELMRDMGNRLRSWGKSKDNEEMAIVLYESAIIADCDVWAMAGLALLYADHDAVLARKLYERASTENWQGEDDDGWRRQEVVQYVLRLARKEKDSRAMVVVAPE